MNKKMEILNEIQEDKQLLIELDKLHKLESNIGTHINRVYNFDTELDATSFFVDSIYHAAKKIGGSLRTYTISNITNKGNLSYQNFIITIYLPNYKKLSQFIRFIEKDFLLIQFNKILVSKRGLGLELNMDISFVYKINRV